MCVCVCVCPFAYSISQPCEFLNYNPDVIFYIFMRVGSFVLTILRHFSLQ